MWRDLKKDEGKKKKMEQIQGKSLAGTQNPDEPLQREEGLALRQETTGWGLGGCG